MLELGDRLLTLRGVVRSCAPVGPERPGRWAIGTEFFGISDEGYAVLGEYIQLNGL